MFIGCSFNKGVRYSGVMETSIVENGQLNLLNDTSLWRFPQQIDVVDTCLIVLDEFNNFFFHVYSLDGRALMDFGNRGQGPGELLWCEKFHLSSDKKMMYVYDDISKKIVEYNLDSIFLGIKVFQEYSIDVKKIPFSKTPTIFYDMIPLNGHEFLIKGNHGDLRYGIYDAFDKRIVSIYNSFLEECLDIDSKEEIWSLLSSNTFTLLSPDKSKLVNATYIGGIMEIFSVAKPLEKILLTNSSFIYKPIYGLAEGAIPAYVVSNDKTQLGFEDVYVTDKLIYTVLYDEGSQLEPTSIIIFDWEGNVQKKIEVGKRITKICIDEYNERLYLLALNEDNGYELDVMIL